jgi:hypothetical protein
MDPLKFHVRPQENSASRAALQQAKRPIFDFFAHVSVERAGDTIFFALTTFTTTIPPLNLSPWASAAE